MARERMHGRRGAAAAGAEAEVGVGGVEDGLRTGVGSGPRLAERCAWDGVGTVRLERACDETMARLAGNKSLP